MPLSSYKARILVLAPHMVFPIRNGADKYIASKWGALGGMAHVELVGLDGLYVAGKVGGWNKAHEFKERRGCFSRFNELLNTVSFLCGSQQYLSYKYGGSEVDGFVKRKLAEDWDLIVVSFLSVFQRYENTLGEYRNKVLVETHNFDPKIYSDRASEAVGVKAALYTLAANRSASYLSKLPRNTNLCALGEADSKLYTNAGMNSVHVCSIGMAKVNKRVRFPKSIDAVTFCFVGSLGIQMNSHAIMKFVSDEWLKIRSEFSGARLLVMGSNPSDALVDFLESFDGVLVLPNLSDVDLSERVQECHASLIPFKEANGLKLKVGLSLECGVPILSYLPLDEELKREGFAYDSSRVEDWVDFVSTLQSQSQLEACAEFAFKYCQENSWERVALRSYKAVLKEADGHAE